MGLGATETAMTASVPVGLVVVLPQPQEAARIPATASVRGTPPKRITPPVGERTVGSDLARRQVARRTNGVEARFCMGAVAERLVGRVSAATQRDHRPTGEPEGSALLIQEGDVPLEAERPAVTHSYLHVRHGSILQEMAGSFVRRRVCGE